MRDADGDTTETPVENFLRLAALSARADGTNSFLLVPI